MQRSTSTPSLVKRLILNLLFWTFAGPLIAQDQAKPIKGKQNYQVVVAKNDSVIQVDGVLSEQIWQKAEAAKDFFLNFPNDTAYARNQTEVRLTFDQQNLYVAVICYDDMKKRTVASSLRRDFAWDENDNFTVYLNPSNDLLNGFAFALTPFGVEREGQLFNGQEVAEIWDNKWYSAVKTYADRWVGELKIPFKSLRYKHGATEWRANFARNDLKNNQISSWRPVPIAYWVSSLAYSGELLFQEQLPNPGANISLIPYAANRVERNFEGNQPTTSFPGVGFDAKVAITPALNLDLTINPDFSQVEVDQQVTNLDRFELFFPERRQFFIENNDLFDSFGFENLKPFFSRRIGIGRDQTTGLIRQTPILFGARLSGKLDNNWRVGLLNIQTGRQRGTDAPLENYTVAAIQRQLFSRSNLAVIAVNRQSNQSSADRYTRLVGADYNLQTEDNKWSGKIFYHRAFQPDNKPGNFVHGTQLQYQVRNLTATWAHEHVGANYQPNDVGYVTRGAHWRVNPQLNFTFFAKNPDFIISHGPFVEFNAFANLNRQVTDQELDLAYQVNFANTSQLFVGVFNYYTYFFFPFDPTNSGGAKIPAGSSFTYNGWFAGYTSDRRKLFTYGFEGYGGQYYNGHNLNLIPEINYRFQPFGSVGLRVEYNQLRFPEPYSSTTFWLIAPRVDITFTRKLFLTTFFQYNQQLDNVNAYIRFQWRFKPVSDFFLTYQDNYFPGDFRVKYRELAVKLIYWFNL